MRNYELTFIIPSDVADNEISDVIATIQSWIESLSGKIIKIDQWGRRKLAYNIKEFTEGHYVAVDLEMDPTKTTELESNLKLSTKVLRYLLIRAGA